MLSFKQFCAFQTIYFCHSERDQYLFRLICKIYMWKNRYNWIKYKTKTNSVNSHESQWNQNKFSRFHLPTFENCFTSLFRINLLSRNLLNSHPSFPNWDNKTLYGIFCTWILSTGQHMAVYLHPLCRLKLAQCSSNPLHLTGTTVKFSAMPLYAPHLASFQHLSKLAESSD